MLFFNPSQFGLDPFLRGGDFAIHRFADFIGVVTVAEVRDYALPMRDLALMLINLSAQLADLIFGMTASILNPTLPMRAGNSENRIASRPELLPLPIVELPRYRSDLFPFSLDFFASIRRQARILPDQVLHLGDKCLLRLEVALTFLMPGFEH